MSLSKDAKPLKTADVCGENEDGRAGENNLKSKNLPLSTNLVLPMMKLLMKG